jgi:hypothetical protein
LSGKTVVLPKTGREEEIKELIDKMGCLERAGCDEVRARLIRIGQPAVPQLTEAFKNRELDEKIQAARTLAGIGKKESIIFLIESMRSDDFETRYAAIQGLPLAGQKAINPLMRELIAHGNEITFRSGAHTVLHGIAAVGYLKLLKPVLMALEGPESELTAPLAAHKVMEKTGQAV